jgi:hypothetical protein
MGVLAKTLAAIWLAMVPPDEIETPDARAARLAVIATAVELETRDALEAALVAETIQVESGRLRLDVHDGRRLGDEGRAICLGQVWRQTWLPRREWAALPGTDLDSTRRCVRAVVRVYRSARCSTLERQINAYATGSCSRSWSGAKARLHGAWKLAAVFRVS